MRYSITFVEDDYRMLGEHLHQPNFEEQGAHLLCSLSFTGSESRLLVREVIPARQEEVISASSSHMEIAPQSFMRAMKRADARHLSFVSFIPTHTVRPAILRRTMSQSPASFGRRTRVSGAGHSREHGVLRNREPQARIWHPDGSTSAVEVIRVIGSRFRFIHRVRAKNVSEDVFDRQVRAFGADIQELLVTLRIGIVGNGGTGSAVAEQLIRLGVGRLSLFEGQTLDASNVTRVYGSRLIDVDRPKVEIIERLAKEIGFGTEVTVFPKPITDSATAKALRNCDVIFGCTDDEWGRSILSKLAFDYYIPVFDMGVKIDSKEGAIVSVQGRVTTLLPGTACLLCRGRITAEGIRAQVIESYNSQQAEELRRQHYAPELHGNAPAVIAFTSAVASTAVSELLHRLTGFMGADRISSEVIHFFDQSRMRTNHLLPAPDCYCGDKQRWGIGDQQPFLGMLWQR